MKTWWINIFTFFEMLARIFVFLFSNNRSISVYCLGIYKINGLIWFHVRLKRIELFWTELFWQALQIHRRKRRKYFEQRDKVKNNRPIRGAIKTKAAIQNKNKRPHCIKVGRLVRLRPFACAFKSSDLKAKLLLRYLLMTFVYDVIVKVFQLSFLHLYVLGLLEDWQSQIRLCYQR